MNGIILINKPVGMTSADVVYQLRKILNIKKIGHAGTLDPEVDGVLPIAVGQATKLIDTLHERQKQYNGTGRIGVKTDSGDLTGKEIMVKELSGPINVDKFELALNTLTGDIEQIPPMYSAVKVNGRKLYEYARAGETVVVPPRIVNISEFKLRNQPIYWAETKTEDFDFSVTCSKGTYVRTLVEQVGDSLGYPAVMVKLTRTKSAGFDLTQTVTIEEVEKNKLVPDKFLLPIDTIFSEMTKVELTDYQFEKAANGAILQLVGINANKIALVYAGKIKAIYELANIAKKLYKPNLMLLKNE